MKGTKRTADELDTEDYGVSNSAMHDAPRIIRRHRSRLRPLSPPAYSTLPDAPSTSHPQPNIFQRFLRHPNLFFQLIIRLPLPSLVALYAIDKEFHYRLNKYGTSIIHEFAEYHAGEAANVFSWGLYPTLCVSDPDFKPMDRRPHLARDTPTLRWARLVLYRAGVIREILTLLALEGHRVPRDMVGVLSKFWILMEHPRQTTRLQFLHSTAFWTNKDILLFHLFLVKLDMRFSHPVQNRGICALGHLLLRQKNLVVLRDVLAGRIDLSTDEVDGDDLAAEFAVYTYLPEDLDIDEYPWLNDELDMSILGENFGLLSREGWDMNGVKMDSAADMVVEEGVRRELNVQKWLLDLILYGTGEDVKPVRKWRGEERVVVQEEGLLGNAEMETVLGKLDGRFGVEKGLKS